MIYRKTPQFNAGDTLLFEVKKQQHNQSQLKDFIHFIKYCGRRGPIRFKHIEERAELMANLTLKENLLLDLGMRENTNKSISELLKKEERLALSKLMDCVKDENTYPADASTEDKKIISIIKILFHSSDYLFLEKPEKFLCEEKQKVFFDALFASKEKFNQTLLITSDHRNLWLQYVSKIVSKAPNGHFVLSDIVRHSDTSNVVELKTSNTDFNSKKAA
ncbi:hypothetical protein [Halobacteriovorax sp. JY17]|uniref:hypothetical protein n=1 Tax=Halobacteriovorax sp. JY17 TaxID=2014617 RepID=UPI000C539AA9|nr:hypothetical protein [Halobacteriovorax sp. JY17]PIK15867.1 MAG: hypothetical protein CES88_03840 [Halobacteriovorax sp. JY17]